MKEYIKEIIEWHEKAFPNATEFAQYKKANEEIIEMWEAGINPTRRLEEKADVCIALIVLAYRFNSQIAQLLLIGIFYERMDLQLLEAIQDKMKINKKRKWVQNEEGVFHHVN